MATIEKRFKEIAYKADKMGRFWGNPPEPKSKEIIFIMCETLKKEDFPEFAFNSGFICLGDGFKFLTYCGKEQKENINKNALVIQKKLTKGKESIYRVYLMDKEEFNIRDLFNSSEFRNNKRPCEENGYNLSPSFYAQGGLKESYDKEELIYIIQTIQNKLIDWSLKNG